MYGGHVNDVHLNDVDPSIWSFWKSVLDETEGLVELIRKTPITVEQWQKQKKIHKALDGAKPLELGFATFFLNRTNRSGVIKGAGVIGGLSQQGNYKLDCRFNRDDLIRRIRRVAKYRRRIHLYKKDAVVFMKKTAPNLADNCFFCIDPPYFNKGSSLYTNFYGPDEHGDVAKAVLDLRQPWIVTYDYTDEIRRLYSKRRQFAYDINYSVQTKRIGSELLIASPRLRLPEELRVRQINFIRASAA